MIIVFVNVYLGSVNEFQSLFIANKNFKRWTRFAVSPFLAIPTGGRITNGTKLENAVATITTDKAREHDIPNNYVFTSLRMLETNRPIPAIPRIL